MCETILSISTPIEQKKKSRKVPIEINLRPAIMAAIAQIFHHLQTFNKVLWKDSLPKFQLNLMKNTQNTVKI